MAEKTPVRVVFNASNVATGMAEFQSGDAVGIEFGGTGLNAIGSAGQIIKVNAAGTALEFGAEGDLSITNLVAPTNADLTLTTSGTGNIVLDAITIRGTTITSADSSTININDNVEIDGNLVVTGTVDFNDQNISNVGSLSIDSISGDADTNTSITFSGSDVITIATGGSGRLTVGDGALSPVTDSQIDLGTSSLYYKDAYIDSITTTGNVSIGGNLDVTGTLDLSDSNFTNVGALQLDSIAGDGDTNTSITFSGSDVITVATGGSTALTVNADQTVTFSGAVAGTSADFDGGVTIDNITIDGQEIDVSSGDLTIDVAGDLILEAGADINVPANIGMTFGDDGEKIEGDGTNLTISSSGNAIIDAASSINLDAGSGLINFKDDGTKFFVISKSSTSAILSVDPSDGDMIFKGDDGGSVITALTLDMSEAGSATFNHDVILPNNGILQFGDAGENIVGDGTDLTIASSNDIKLDAAGNSVRILDSGVDIVTFVNAGGSPVIQSRISDADILLKGSDGGSVITALTLDMSEAGAATFNDAVILGTNKEIQFVDTNESIKSDGSKMIIKSGGTTFNLPTSDGTAGQALITDGAGTLSFDTVSTTTSSDTRAIVKNNKTVTTSARTVDYFQAAAFDMAWYFVALNDLTNDNTSGSVFTVCHNNSDAFIGGPRGGAAGSSNAMPTTSADIASSQVRVKITGPSADSKISFYKIPISRASTSDATAGVTVTTSNTDVDSASESIDTFAHASFRAAKYVILIDDNAKTETGVTEALVVHDGTNAFVTQYGTLQTGNNDMITLSAAISGSNVVLSAAGLTPNLSLKIHKTLLADSMTAESNANQKIIAATTVSSTATAFDSFDLDDATAAVYYVVGKNASEGVFSVQEVYMAGDIGEAGVSSGPFVSTKGTTQLEFTADFLDTTDNTVQMSVSSTSGASTVVNAYRINCLAE